MSVLERVREQERMGEGLPGTSGEAGELRGRLKGDLVDRLGLSAISSMVSGGDPARARAELEVACQAILNTRGYEGLGDEERVEVVRQVIDEVVGLGPLQPLLDDDTVTEVMVNGCEHLFYERAGEIHAAERVFE